MEVEDQVLRSLNQKRLEVKNIPYQKINSQVIKMLQELRKRGLEIGLVSNCSAEETDGLFLCSLFPLIDVMVLSYREGLSKPQPEIYELACQRLGIHPSEAIFIGDGGANELVGAEKAGIKAYRAAWFYNRPVSDPFHQIDKPMDVLNLIESLSTR